MSKMLHLPRSAMLLYGTMKDEKFFATDYADFTDFVIIYYSQIRVISGIRGNECF